MKVLASLKPYYYYLVGEGIKKIEVRKGEPKAKDWDREVLLYCSKDMKSFNLIPDEYKEKYRKYLGRVCARFVCDDIYHLEILGSKPHKYFTNGTCLTQEELEKYANGKFLYGWHISDLKIYDKPKELGKFKKGCNDMSDIMYGSYCNVCDNRCRLTRPPQSWCYVEI